MSLKRLEMTKILDVFPNIESLPQTIFWMVPRRDIASQCLIAPQELEKTPIFINMGGGGAVAGN